MPAAMIDLGVKKSSQASDELKLRSVVWIPSVRDHLRELRQSSVRSVGVCAQIGDVVSVVTGHA